MFAEYLASEKDALQIDSDDPIELLFRDIEKWCRRVDAGAVHDDVDMSGALQYGAQQRLDLRFTGGLCRVKPAASAFGLDHCEPRPGLLFISPNDDDLGACARQPLGHRAAKLAGAADDDR